MQALPVTSPSTPSPRREEGPDPQDGRFGAVMAALLPFQVAPAPEAPVAREASQAPDSVKATRPPERGQPTAKAPEKAEASQPPTKPDRPSEAQGPDQAVAMEKASQPAPENLQARPALQEASQGPALAPPPVALPAPGIAPEAAPPPLQAGVVALPNEPEPPKKGVPVWVPSGALPGTGSEESPLAPRITLPASAPTEPIHLQLQVPTAEVASPAASPDLPPSLTGAPALPPPIPTPQPARLEPTPKIPLTKGTPAAQTASPTQLVAGLAEGPSAGSGAAPSGQEGSLQAQSGEPGGEGLRLPLPAERAPVAEALRPGEAPKGFAPEPLAPKAEPIRAEIPRPDGAKLQAPPGPAREVSFPLPSLAPVAAAPTVVKAPPSPAVTQVEGTLRWMIKGPVPEARLQLHPESLGKVSIELKIEDGQVHAKVWVQEPAAMQALQEGRASLEQALKQSGLQLGSFDLQQGGDASRQAPEPNSHQGPAIKEDPALRAARQEAPALGGPPPANSRRIELYA